MKIGFLHIPKIESFSVWIDVFMQLVRRDIQDQYLGTFLGPFWVFIRTFCMVVVMSFVIQYGLKTTPTSDISFIVWLLPAYAAVSFFSEAISKSTYSIVAYASVIKKIKIKIFLLPFIRIFAAFYSQMLFLFLLMIFLWLNRIPPSLYWFQIIYYVVALSCLLVGLSWLFSAVTVFVRDVSQALYTFLGFLMWLTPVFWDINNVSGWVKWAAYLNPLTYISEGYRASFFGQVLFWHNPIWTVYYWGVVLFFLLVGGFVFWRLQPYFADVL